MCIRFDLRYFISFASLCLSISISSAQSLPTDIPESVGMSSARLDHVSAVIDSEISTGNLPGAVVMVSRKGRLVYSRALGYQDKASAKPMGINSIFRIYSMTKPFVEVAAMILVEDGMLDLADPVSKYLPEFSNMQVSIKATNSSGQNYYKTVPATSPITILDLLRHTSGIGYPDESDDPAISNVLIKSGLYIPTGPEQDWRQVTPKEMISAISAAPLNSEPGTVWQYGLSVDLLGRIIEVVSKRNLGDFLYERLFKPLGMKDTGFKVSSTDLDRIAEPFATDPISGLPIELLNITGNIKNISGGSGGVSTAGDYMNFISMLLNGGEFNGQRILSPMTINLMTSNMLGGKATKPLNPGQYLLGSDGYTFGLGFLVRETQGLANLDGSPGEYLWAGFAGTFFWNDPKEKLSVVVMAQSPGPLKRKYRRLFKQLISSAIIH